MAQQVFGKLYQFTDLGGQMSLPVHQYLLATEPSVMFATGSYQQADWILPQIKNVLKGKPLDYLFISHMESDECGGIALFLKKYPHVKVLCSAFTAKELQGYGFRPDISIVDDLKNIRVGDIDLKFFRYPSEVHLMDGMLVAELKSGVFYSSDLMFHHITHGAKVVESEWKKEVATIDRALAADTVRCERLKEELLYISPRFIAAGHGSCTLTTDGNGK